MINLVLFLLMLKFLKQLSFCHLLLLYISDSAKFMCTTSHGHDSMLVAANNHQLAFFLKTKNSKHSALDCIQVRDGNLGFFMHPLLLNTQPLTICHINLDTVSSFSPWLGQLFLSVLEKMRGACMGAPTKWPLVAEVSYLIDRYELVTSVALFKHHNPN